MRRVFTISLTREGDLFVAQCLDVDVASQGTTAEEAIDNLREAIELHFEPPAATLVPNLLSIEIEIDAAYHVAISRSEAATRGSGLR